ncbi:hypothetical protein GGR50DRAFT_380029 [Xylaria sp. CBS 124048]|nr:hypothetical protein GGR50DRAFT_380029 [Xylaria sp. CBS 124048]
MTDLETLATIGPPSKRRKVQDDNSDSTTHYAILEKQDAQPDKQQSIVCVSIREKSVHSQSESRSRSASRRRKHDDQYSTSDRSRHSCSPSSSRSRSRSRSSLPPSWCVGSDGWTDVTATWFGCDVCTGREYEQRKLEYEKCEKCEKGLYETELCRRQAMGNKERAGYKVKWMGG